jgi:hypothetical protein
MRERAQPALARRVRLHIPGGQQPRRFRQHCQRRRIAAAEDDGESWSVKARGRGGRIVRRRICHRRRPEFAVECPRHRADDFIRRLATGEHKISGNFGRESGHRADEKRGSSAVRTLGADNHCIYRPSRPANLPQTPSNPRPAAEPGTQHCDLV